MLNITKASDRHIAITSGDSVERVDAVVLLGSVAAVCREMGLDVPAIAGTADWEHRSIDGQVRPITSVSLTSEPLEFTPWQPTGEGA